MNAVSVLRRDDSYAIQNWTLRLFAYALPGGLYTAVLLYLLVKHQFVQINYVNLSTVEPLVLVGIIVFSGFCYIMGYVFEPLADKLWYKRFKPKNLFRSIVVELNKTNSDVQIQLDKIDWLIALSYIRRINLEIARDVEQVNVTCIMLRNISFGFLIIALIALIEAVQQNFALPPVIASLGSFAISIITVRQAVKFNKWFFQAICQTLAALLLEPSQLPIKVQPLTATAIQSSQTQMMSKTLNWEKSSETFIASNIAEAQCYNRRMITRATSINTPPKTRISLRAIRTLAAQIAQQFQPEKIILFGSYAYGKPRPWSDVDLLVVMDTPLRNREQAAQIARALDYHFGLDLLVRTPEQLRERLVLGDFFLREITAKGKVLYARSDSRVGG